MARRGFYEDYQKNKEQKVGSDRPVLIRNSAASAIASFISRLITTVMYLAAICLSSVGLTTLINKPLRDMLFELISKLFFGN